FVCDFRGRGAAGNSVCDVEREVMRLAAVLADLCGRLGGCVAVDGERDALRDLAGIAERNCAADARPCAGHHRDVILQKSWHGSFPLKCGRRIATSGKGCYIGKTGASLMCRNIKTLVTFDPTATEDEIRASALQFVRKVSGFNKPSQANAAAFDSAVDEVSEAARRLLASLHTAAPARDREVEAEKARARARERFA